MSCGGEKKKQASNKQELRYKSLVLASTNDRMGFLWWLRW